MYRFSNGVFYPHTSMPDYINAGVWPIDGVDVSEDVFAQFTGLIPEMMEVGTNADGMPALVSKSVFAKPGWETGPLTK